MSVSHPLPADRWFKALSVRQPWAWLLANGWKDLENRSWHTRFRGPFLIHAGQAFDRQGLDWVRAHFPEIQLPDEFDRGGIVGAASIVDCVSPKDVLAGRCTSPWYMGQHGFVVSGAMALPFYPCAGRLSFFPVELPEAVAELARKGAVSMK